MRYEFTRLISGGDVCTEDRQGEPQPKRSPRRNAYEDDTDHANLRISRSQQAPNSKLSREDMI